METSKVISKFQDLLKELNFETISKLDEKDYEKFILEFFVKINRLKFQGLEVSSTLKGIIDKVYYDFSTHFDKSPLYEERIQDIFMELTGFCPPPKFWNTPFEEYMRRKWKIL